MCQVTCGLRAAGRGLRARALLCKRSLGGRSDGICAGRPREPAGGRGPGGKCLVMGSGKLRSFCAFAKVFLEKKKGI